jgi:unsaturated rhamnogalacturonyl hydrolase
LWGVGNGWAAAGMARVIDVLPDGSARQQIIDDVSQLLDGCLVYLRDDGLFHDVVNNPDTFIETNLAQMLAYTIYRGIRAGWLHEMYRDSADKMRAAAFRKVDAFGLVQDVCGAPMFDRPGVAPEGQAFFLLMESVVPT